MDRRQTGGDWAAISRHSAADSTSNSWLQTRRFKMRRATSVERCLQQAELSAAQEAATRTLLSRLFGSQAEAEKCSSTGGQRLSGASEQVRWNQTSLECRQEEGARIKIKRPNEQQLSYMNRFTITQSPHSNTRAACDFGAMERLYSSSSLTSSVANYKRNNTNNKILLFIQVIQLVTGCCLLMSSLLAANCSAYQLTNNLIANNLPPKFITTPLATSSSPNSHLHHNQQQSQASNSEIVVRVKEGAGSIGKLIYTLRGEDPDEDPLTFGVLGSMAGDLLRIENVPVNQANVYLRKELDRETTESYQVVITLTDGKLGRGNWVEDVNDNYPVFGPHRTAISIREDVKVPLVIETIEASDQDEGRFGQVVYKLDEMDESSAKSSSSPLSSMFSIETIDGKGVISLISPLDYEQKPLYQLRILAVDRAIEHERLSAATSIMISVEDCEDQPPMFTFVPSITRIPENLPVGSPIVRVAAIDGDRGVNNQIEYRLISVNGQESGLERNLFAINAQTGQIRVAGELDREATTSMEGSWWTHSHNQQASSNSNSQQQRSQPGSYVLQVRASELNSANSKDMSVTTELTVILTDVNDETPTFSQTAYFGEILENSTPESLVSFIVGSSSLANFQGQEFSSAASSSSSSGSQVAASAKVFDRDQGTNGTFTLNLEGEHAYLFDIWPREATNEANFMIKVNLAQETQARLQQSAALDYERNKLFRFNIVAQEKYNNQQQQQQQGGLRSNTAQMTVYLKDSNDNFPQFESDLYRVEVPENAIKGMHVCAVKASDSDSGIYGTQGIRYTEIRGEKANKFKLDPLTGVVSLKANDHGFDRETVAQHYLIVEARDANGSGNRNTTQLLIILTDTNDQKPKFLLDQYEAFIYENEPDFQSPLQVQAVDNDAANTLNSKITYSIVGGDPQQNFTIDPQTGRIRVRNSLVLAPLSSSSAPNTIGGSQRSPGLSKSSDVNSSDDLLLSSESAGTSEAAGENLSGGLDFERIAQKRDDTRQFNLTIKATDSGLPEPLSDLTHVIILVYDKNDHAPVFTRNVYTKSIREDAKEGSQVLQVLAHDGDHSPTNSKITYRISSGASDKFVIDSDSGMISVANGANLDIDRVVGGQRRTNYLLNVIAFDGSFGTNQKSASALVNITIIDVNNKSPEFVTWASSIQQQQQQQLQQTSRVGNGASTTTSPATTGLLNQQQQQLMVVSVNEDAPYGLIITRVVAIDLDSSAELRYSINYARSEARNEDMVLVDPSLIRDLFSIEPTDGTIKIAKQLDRELFDQVKLRIQVEDIAAQTPDQVAHTYLLVKITDVNDNRPVFKKPVYKAVVNENSISGTSVITLTADDRDLNKTLKYSLDGPAEMLRLIRINSRSGETIVNDKIDRELFPMINVTVRAEDYGHPHPLTGSALLLITVRDENDNNPIFLNSSQLESANYQQHANRYQSPHYHDIRTWNHNMQSPDTNNNSSPSYRLRSLGSPRVSSSFGDLISPATTTTTIGGHLMLESAMLDETFTGTTQAGTRQQLAFLSPGSTVKIREDAPVGLLVAYVRAEDADVGNNGRVTYLLDAASSGGKFRISRDTGVISVAGSLDRETNKLFSLIIEACDNYDLGYSTGESRRAFTQVNIQILDINDNAPVISTNLQSGASSTGSLDSASSSSAAAAASTDHRASGSSPYPSYDDILSSPGPYEVPLANCLFISEFQALNEPILTITATDADDPGTQNGQIDLSIVNNLPQNELFGLIPIPKSPRPTTANSVATSAETNASDRLPTKPLTSSDYSGFGDVVVSDEEQLDKKQQPREHGQPGDAESDDKSHLLSQARPKRSTASSLGSAPTSSELDTSMSNNANLYSSPSSVVTNYRRNQAPAIVGRNLPAIRQARLATAAPGALLVPATMSTVRHQHSSNQHLDAGEQQAHLIVTQVLKERVGNYSILVRATDRGEPALSSVKLVNICVQDVNNHSPVFTRPPLNYTIRIMENATIGTYVTQVEATDSDHGPNGELQYSLKPTNIQNSNNDWQSFKIDRLSGVITTVRQFNRQLKKYYTLRVQAQDFGRPTSLSSDIDINIMIVNSGQYQPEFDVQSQSLYFTENVAPGQEWFTLLQTTNLDDDPALINPSSTSTNRAIGNEANGNDWPRATPCYFIIDSDDRDQVFHLDRYTHRLTNQKVIDREKKANYTLLVQASNNCNKPPAAPIYTRTLEQQMNTNSQQGLPTIAPSIEYRSSVVAESGSSAAGVDHEFARFTRSTNSSRETQVRDKKSIELQQPQQLKTNGSKFEGGESAKLQANGENEETTAFNQAAADALLANDKTLLKVVIKIRDINDNAPRFTQRVYTGGITTEADFGTIFMIVQAIDADADANSQVVYSIVKPIKRNLVTSSSSSNGKAIFNSLLASSDKGLAEQQPSVDRSIQRRQKRAVAVTTTTTPTSSLVNGNSIITTTTGKPLGQFESELGSSNSNNQAHNNLIGDDIPMNEGDDLFVINPQTGEISLNFDPQKHMKGYFEFEIMANDTDGLFDSARVFIYLLRHDQRVKFVLRLTPQELRQRLNKFRSVFGNITGAIVNIDSYKYFENHDGTVDKKKTSLYLHFVNPDDNTIIEVDKVLTLIDNNIEYLDELYKEFHVLSSEAAHLPLSSSALIDPIDQIRTGLLGVSSFLALILVLVIALCLNQRTRYERQLKAATVSAFGSSPLHLDPEFQSQTNLPNTNLHSQDPNPIWMNGYSSQDWLNGGAGGISGATIGEGAKSNLNSSSQAGGQHGAIGGHLNVGIEDADYLSSENSDLNSLNGANYNVATTATPRDSLNSSHGRVSGSSSTTNDRQALCRGNNNSNNNNNNNNGGQTPQQHHGGRNEASGVLKIDGQMSASAGGKAVAPNQAAAVSKKRSQLNDTITHSTFGAFKEVTIYTDHNQQLQPGKQQQQQQQQQQQGGNMIRNNQQQQQVTSQVNKIASQLDAKHLARTRQQGTNQIYISQQQQQQHLCQQQQRIIVHTNGADVNKGIIKTSAPNQMGGNSKMTSGRPVSTNMMDGSANKLQVVNGNNNLNSCDSQYSVNVISIQHQEQQHHNAGIITAENIDSNLSKLSILNLETTEL